MIRVDGGSIQIFSLDTVFSRTITAGMRQVLIVDFSIYRHTLDKIFTEAGYRTQLCESAYEAMQKLKAYEFDLIISEVELPGDNAFDLYNYISTKYPYIPTIVTTDKMIDTIFDRIFGEGIGNVLCKPVKKDDILTLAEKLITKENIFGLENYLRGMTDRKRIRITASTQIQKAIPLIMKQIESWGHSLENRMILNLLLNEMAINAVYHSHGFTREKESRVPITLEPGKFVDIAYGNSGATFGISITDYNGRLTKERILGSINSVITQNRDLLRAAQEGADISNIVSETGRGIDLVRKLCGEYYFIIKRNVRTEIIMLFDSNFVYDSDSYTSLKIIEDLT